jgi:hypothetical protein
MAKKYKGKNQDSTCQVKAENNSESTTKIKMFWDGTKVGIIIILTRLIYVNANR